MNQSNLTFQPGEAVISAIDCFPSFSLLRDDFDPFALADFCVGIDAAILHQRLYTFGLPDFEENPTVKVLVDNNLLVDAKQTGQYSIDPREFISHPNAKYPALILFALQNDLLKLSYPKKIHDPKVAEKVFSWMISALLSSSKSLIVEDRTKMPIVPSASESIVWRNHPRLIQEDASFRLLNSEIAKTYTKLSNLLLSIRQSIDGESQIAMPPLALQVLSRSDSPNQIGESLLDVRHKYRKLREYYTESEAVLDDPKISLKRKLEKKARLEKAIIELLGEEREKDSFTTYVSLAKSLNDVIAVEKLFDGFATGDIGIGKLIGFLISNVQSVYWRFRLRPLHATKTTYLKMSSYDISKTIKKHFKHEITDSDRAQITGFEQLIQSAFSVANELERELNDNTS